MNEAVITGIGIVSPLGLGREKTWQALLKGKSAVTSGPEGGFLRASIVDLPVPPEGRLLALGFLAAAEAFQDSDMNMSSVNPGRIGCAVSVSKPYLGTGEKLAVSEQYYPSMLGEQLCRIFKLRGPLQNIAAACATGTNSIILASEWIRQGVCDIVIAGAVESSFHPLYEAGFSQMGVLARSRVSPFGQDREGFALGEGGAVFVLESKEHALYRGVKKIYGEVAGWAMANDVRHPVAFASDGEIIAQAIRTALKKASTDIPQYISAHGTATKLNDVIETEAIKKAFGEKAYGISISSTKAATGHLLGASGAIECAISMLSLRDQLVPPTLNLFAPDPQCDLDYTPLETRRRDIRTVLSLSFGFGGQIGVIALNNPRRFI